MPFRHLPKSRLLIALPLGMLLACHPSQSPKMNLASGNRGPIAELISTRPTLSGPAKIMVRLPAEPLSKTAKAERHEQLKLINLQQQNLRDQLQTISSQIKIVYSYKHILNALYVAIPEDLIEKVDPILPQGSHVELTTSFRRPTVLESDVNSANTSDLAQHNSVRFIGTDLLHAQGLKGEDIKVGVIDTGIDYTHSMLGGSGLVDDYKKINPAQTNDQFPNRKVVGGYDFAGSDYDSASPNPLLRIPNPDPNPLDESGHGSHVAGTIAGIGDGVASYSGVAPEASLYALKVFGKDGSTDDAVVMAALEYAADPDSNIETDDHLDVVNLSLGSPYGSPKMLYREAITNLNNLGTVVVASAGNSGDVSYITGAPAVTEEALSVAASIDDMNHNWHFDAASFQFAHQKEEVVAEFAEAAFSRPLKDITELQGPLVYIGKAAQLTEQQKNQLPGKIALIDRGEIPFFDKINNAQQAGAIAAVVINNVDGEPMTMGGGKDSPTIPAVMITLATGKNIRQKVSEGETVSVNLKSTQKFAKPELIDTLTNFSSRGPRSEDSLIKPEIAAPGANIISAKVGGGTEIVQMSGTSMAAPHMAGVIALLKQSHSQLSAQGLKALAMLTAKSIKDSKGQDYPIAQQGAGRIQVAAANESKIVAVPASLSLGRNEIQSAKVITRTLSFTNLNSSDLQLTVIPKLDSGLELIEPTSINLKGNQEVKIRFRFRIKSPSSEGYAHELDGFVQLRDQTNTIYSLPVLAVALKTSDVKAESLKVQASSAIDQAGSLATLTVHNPSPHRGVGYLFNLLGQDEIKDDRAPQKQGLNNACDLESIGYRTLKVDVEGKTQEVLQMALKLHNPLTTWNSCEFSVQIDANGDGMADQELAGASRANTEGLGRGFASLLLDADKARQLRKDYEKKILAKDEKAELDFTGAIEASMDIKADNHTSLMIIQTPIKNLKTVPGRSLRIKVGALSLEQDAIEADDFLAKGSWLELPLDPKAQTVVDIPEVIEIGAASDVNVEMTMGEGERPLIIYTPFNRGAMTSTKDLQSQILNMIYL